MSEEKLSYLFSSTPLLFEPNAISSIPITTTKPCEEYVEDTDSIDLDLLPHRKMSWGSLEDRYMLFEVVSDDTDSTISSTSSTLSSDFPFLCNEIPTAINEDAIRCTNESSWGSYTLDANSWDDDKAPVVKLRHHKEILFNELEFCGFFTDRMIGTGLSFLSKSPENGLYVLNKCVMRNMSLSNITMLHYHRYLRYIDLAYNHISNLIPLGGIPYLMYLNLAHNRTSTILNFTPPWYLTYVNLSYNYITKMRDISAFWSIVHLDLSHNAIEVIFGLQNLKYLKHLNLSYNLIECMENLDKLNIQILNLEGNCITSFKSAVPDHGITTLPHLREIYLGYNRISNLEFFKGGYSLRVIDLKFNKINDLLELTNFKGLIYKIDLTGNSCTKWPNYKAVVLFSIPSVKYIDGDIVSNSEKVSAAILFSSPMNVKAARTVTKLTLLEYLSTPKIDLYVVPYDEPSPPLIILTGPSAVKKISLSLHVAQTFPKRVRYCQWHTTRELEQSQIEHEAYISVNREEFNDMTRRGEFLAIQEALGNSYGFHHNQIRSLILENKIGIIQMSLHSTLQMSKRYSNIKPILVLTESEKVHRNWIQEKFDVYTCIRESIEDLVKETKMTKQNTLESKGTTLDVIKDILNDIIGKIKSSPNDVKIDVQENKNSEVVTTEEEVEKETRKYITFKHEEKKELEREVGHSATEYHNLTFEHKLSDQSELRVILDEHSNIIVEDETVKRERHQAKLLHRRNTLILGTDDLSESISSEDINEVLSEPKKPELLKDIYTNIVIKTRKIYLDHHVNNPGFFSIVLLTDDYLKSFNKLIDFVYEIYTNHSTEKPKFQSEIEHYSEAAIPEMIDNVVDEMRQSLSTSILQRKTLLRSYGITSWKDLMPSQIDHSVECVETA